MCFSSQHDTFAEKLSAPLWSQIPNNFLLSAQINLSITLSLSLALSLISYLILWSLLSHSFSLICRSFLSLSCSTVCFQISHALSLLPLPFLLSLSLSLPSSYQASHSQVVSLYHQLFSVTRERSPCRVPQTRFCRQLIASKAPKNYPIATRHIFLSKKKKKKRETWIQLASSENLSKE